MVDRPKVPFPGKRSLGAAPYKDPFLEGLSMVNAEKRRVDASAVEADRARQTQAGSVAGEVIVSALQAGELVPPPQPPEDTVA